MYRPFCLPRHWQLQNSHIGLCMRVFHIFLIHGQLEIGQLCEKSVQSNLQFAKRQILSDTLMLSMSVRQRFRTGRKHPVNIERIRICKHTLVSVARLSGCDHALSGSDESACYDHVLDGDATCNVCGDKMCLNPIDKNYQEYLRDASADAV